MHPILFVAFGREIPSYGVALALALASGVAGLLYFGRKRGIESGALVDLMYVCLFAGLLGARLFYVSFHPQEFTELKRMFFVWQGGLSQVGGLLFALPAYFLYLRRRKLPLWELSDLIGFLMPFCQAMIRLGCFAAGCCGGKECALPWSVVFANMHPTQLYESGSLFLLSALLFMLWKKQKLQRGDIACLYFVGEGALRFSVDFLRADHLPVLLGYSVTQLASLVLFVGALALLWVKRRWRWVN